MYGAAILSHVGLNRRVAITSRQIVWKRLDRNGLPFDGGKCSKMLLHTLLAQLGYVSPGEFPFLG